MTNPAAAAPADAQTTLSNGSSAISLNSPSPIKHKPQYNNGSEQAASAAASSAVVAYESEGACVSCCVAFFYLIGMVLIVVGIGATALITQYPEHVLYLAMAGASGIILGLIFVSLSATMCRPRRRRVVDAKSDVNGNAGGQQHQQQQHQQQQHHKGGGTNRLVPGSNHGGGSGGAGSLGLPSTNRYEVRAGGSADLIDDNLVLSSSPKVPYQQSFQNTANTTTTNNASTNNSSNAAVAYQSTTDSRPVQKSMAPIQLKFAGKTGPQQQQQQQQQQHHDHHHHHHHNNSHHHHQPTISDYTISAQHPYGTLPPAYMTLNGHGHMRADSAAATAVAHMRSHAHAHAHVNAHQYPAGISAHSLVNNYALDAGGVGTGGPGSGGVMMMTPVVPGGSHPSDEVHGGLMLVGHSSLRSPDAHSTATLPLPTRMRSSVSYNDVLLEEPRRVGIHILRQREVSSSDGLDSNGSDDPQQHQQPLTDPASHHLAPNANAGPPQTPTPPSESEHQQQQQLLQHLQQQQQQQQQQQNRVQQQASISFLQQAATAGSGGGGGGGGVLAPVRESQTHNSTSSDERSSPRSDYYSKESSIASTEQHQGRQAGAVTTTTTTTSSTGSHQTLNSQGMQSMNTVGLPQASPRKKPPEVAPKPFMIPNVANLRPVLPQIVQPSFYGRMGHVQGFTQTQTVGAGAGGHHDLSGGYGAVEHGIGAQAQAGGVMMHPANVVGLDDGLEDDPSRSSDLLETQI